MVLIIKARQSNEGSRKTEWVWVGGMVDRSGLDWWWGEDPHGVECVYALKKRCVHCNDE